MIILDTNVLSALMLQSPDAAVVAWVDGQPRTSI
jgi:toxin FitB